MSIQFLLLQCRYLITKANACLKILKMYSSYQLNKEEKRITLYGRGQVLLKNLMAIMSRTINTDNY